MTEDKTCNGWTNYATWRVNLEVFDGFDWSDRAGDFDSIAAIADYLKEYAEEVVTLDENKGPRLAFDYARAFLSEVNYYEIARHIAEDYPNIITGV